METIEIEWKSKKQQTLIKKLLKELKIKFRPVASDNENDDYNLYGEGFKNKIIEAMRAYDTGDMSQFVTIKTEDLWK